MTNFAIIENNIVTNIIVADTLEIAEAVTGVSCVEYVGANSASIGGTYDGTNFTPPSPYPSWLLNTSTRQWQAPKLIPADGEMYLWNEKNLQWEKFVLPTREITNE